MGAKPRATPALREGAPAPAFELEASTGGSISLASLKGRVVVLYFYPKDSTPGCTLEARDFQAALPELDRLGAAVLGVSRDSIASHQRFASKQELSFPLLSDPGGEMIASYGAWGKKSLYGREFEGILRTTVVIDGDGEVARVFPKVRVKGHVDEVLAIVRGLRGEGS
jgi:thioredoxin-dependent peroxiredoxin